MGIYLPNMEMPTSCYGNCPFFTQIPPGIDHGLVNYCCLENWKLPRTPMPFSVEEAKHGRQDFCPLIPVPTHGDLIDKRGVDVLSWNEKDEGDFEDGVLFVLGKLDELPVIIPADDKDYELPADKEGEG